MIVLSDYATYKVSYAPIMLHYALTPVLQFCYIVLLCYLTKNISTLLSYMLATKQEYAHANMLFRDHSDVSARKCTPCAECSCICLSFCRCVADYQSSAIAIVIAAVQVFFRVFSCRGLGGIFLSTGDIKIVGIVGSGFHATGLCPVLHVALPKKRKRVQPIASNLIETEIWSKLAPHNPTGSFSTLRSFTRAVLPTEASKCHTTPEGTQPSHDAV